MGDAEVGEMAQALEHARRDVRGAGVDHGVVVGERDRGQPVLVVAAIEAGPAAVVVLHPHHPGEAAPDRLGTRFRRSAGACLGQHHERHAGVVDVGVKLVLPFEVPAAGRRRVAHGPVARALGLLAEQPGHGARNRGMVGRDRPLQERVRRQHRVPDGREAGLHPQAVLVAQQEAVEVAERLGQQRMLLAVAEQAERQRAVGHRRQDGGEALGLGEPLDHPGARALDCPPAQDPRARNPLADLEQLVDAVKDRLPVGRRRRIDRPEGRGIFQQLAHAAVGGERDHRLLRPDDRQRDEDRARPGRQVVDGERRLPREEEHLGRDGRDALPGDLPEHRQVVARVRVGARDAAQRGDVGARGPHVGRLGRLARHLQREVAEARHRELRRPAPVLIPAPFGQRLGADDAGQIAHLVALASIEERFDQYEVAFQGRVPFQLPLPEPLPGLARDQPVARGRDGGVQAGARRRGDQQASSGSGSESGCSGSVSHLRRATCGFRFI